MLTPFHAYRFSASGPLAAHHATEDARRLRGGVRRYQPAQALAGAVADGQVDVDEAPGLYRYEIHGLGDPLVGVVGLIAIADLLPHEGVRRKRQGRRRDLFEIRPILVIADGEVEVGAPGRSVLEIAGAETSHRILQVSPGDVSIPPPPYVIAETFEHDEPGAPEAPDEEDE